MTKGESTEKQEQACRAYAQANGYVITETFRETTSAKSPRPELARLRRAIKARQFDGVIVPSFAHLSTDTKQLNRIAAEVLAFSGTLVDVSRNQTENIETLKTRLDEWAASITQRPD